VQYSQQYNFKFPRKTNSRNSRESIIQEQELRGRQTGYSLDTETLTHGHRLWGAQSQDRRSDRPTVSYK